MTDDSISYSDIEAVANGWIIDFFFISACRFFKEDKHEELNKSLQSLEVIIQGTANMKLVQVKKMQLCGFLSRVINGKRLDIQFESDKQIVPLMSALSIWKSFCGSVADQALFEDIKMMLFIQSAGVCLEQGHYDMALEVLERIQEEHEMPEELQMKLAAIVKRKDVYHKCFAEFSFTRLVESIKTFLDAVLKVYPSDFLLKAASKVVSSCQGAGVEEHREGLEVSGQAALLGEDSQKNHGASACSELTWRKFRHKRRLLPKNASPWKPEPGKKLYGGIKRHTLAGDLPNRCSSRLNKNLSLQNSTVNGGMKRNKKRKWRYEEDLNLRAGVRRHGEGRWSQILLDFDFPDRTGVMLKDRWRTLKKLGMDK